MDYKKENQKNQSRSFNTFNNQNSKIPIYQRYIDNRPEMQEMAQLYAAIQKQTLVRNDKRLTNNVTQLYTNFNYVDNNNDITKGDFGDLSDGINEGDGTYGLTNEVGNDSPPKANVMKISQALDEELGGQYFIAGHLMNAELGGKGDEQQNISAFTRSANSQHHSKFEKYAKNAVRAIIKSGNVSNHAIKVVSRVTSRGEHQFLNSDDETKNIEGLATSLYCEFRYWDLKENKFLSETDDGIPTNYPEEIAKPLNINPSQDSRLKSRMAGTPTKSYSAEGVPEPEPMDIYETIHTHLSSGIGFYKSGDRNAWRSLKGGISTRLGISSMRLNDESVLEWLSNAYLLWAFEKRSTETEEIVSDEDKNIWEGISKSVHKQALIDTVKFMEEKFNLNGNDIINEAMDTD